MDTAILDCDYPWVPMIEVYTSLVNVIDQRIGLCMQEIGVL